MKDEVYNQTVTIFEVALNVYLKILCCPSPEFCGVSLISS
jgi:hypothetical protein